MRDDERAVVAQAKTDRRAFGQLYDRYVERIYAYAYRQTQDVAAAQDITAVTFEKALNHLDQFNWQGKSFCAWLYRIAYNEAMQHHRRQRWLAPLKFFQPRPNTQKRQPETAVQQQEHRAILHQALDKLAKRDKDIIVLRFFEELATDDIAVILNCSSANVYVRLHRALKRLRHQIEKLDSTQEVDYVIR
ncbi:MAG: sigma-70 family RNA polymerase sigma factor [Chloroflexota bacterium]